LNATTGTVTTLTSTTGNITTVNATTVNATTTTTSGVTTTGTLTFSGGGSLTKVPESAIKPITATVSANALTVTLNATTLDFRSSTLTSGTVVSRAVTSAISVTVSSGSTLGTVSATQSRIVVLALDNAGTVELAVVNISGGNDLTETGLISTTAEGGAGAADSASVVYSTTARTNVAYRVVGYIESTQATAGTWATTPSTIQGCGGQALTAMSSLGYSQVWTAVSSSRAFGTTYYNTTGRPILVSVNASGGNNTSVSLTVNSLAVQGVGNSTGGTFGGCVTAIVPPSGTYSASGTMSLSSWFELR
jgi:hypothetical protein